MKPHKKAENPDHIECLENGIMHVNIKLNDINFIGALEKPAFHCFVGNFMWHQWQINVTKYKILAVSLQQ